MHSCASDHLGSIKIDKVLAVRLNEDVRKGESQNHRKRSIGARKGPLIEGVEKEGRPKCQRCQQESKTPGVEVKQDCK